MVFVSSFINPNVNLYEDCKSSTFLDSYKCKGEKRKKYNSETLKLIQDYYQEHSYKTKSDILHYLKTEYQLKLSSTTLNKIIADCY